MNTSTSLRDLSACELDASRKLILREQESVCRGRPEWKRRKLAEAHSMLALDQIVPRVAVLDLDIRTEWNVVVALRCPVPCLSGDSGDGGGSGGPPGQKGLSVKDGCLLAIRYPEAAMTQPEPGFAFVGVMQPRNLLHPYVSADPYQRLCLAAHVAPGTPVAEILFSAWGALTMQTVRIDPGDPAGLMNASAAIWWLDHLQEMPLTREAFFPEGTKK